MTSGSFPSAQDGTSIDQSANISASADHMLTTPVPEAFQERVQPWLMACFGAMIAGDREERNHRFLEEALELVQSLGCTASETHQLVDYVYGREIGRPVQEVGGVMVTLAALCLANELNMHAAGEAELARIWTKVEAIRVKQAAKPKYSPLPQHVAEATGPLVVENADGAFVASFATKLLADFFIDDGNGCYRYREQTA